MRDMRFHFADYLLDPDRRELRRNGAPLALEPQVFDLLVYLVNNRDRVVSKDALLKDVWDGRIVSDAAIDSRVRAARQALSDSGVEQRFIRTMPRKGLRFVCEVHEDDGVPTEATAGSGPVQQPPRTVADRTSIAVLPFINNSNDSE